MVVWSKSRIRGVGGGGSSEEGVVGSEGEVRDEEVVLKGEKGRSKEGGGEEVDSRSGSSMEEIDAVEKVEAEAPREGRRERSGCVTRPHLRDE